MSPGRPPVGRFRRPRRAAPEDRLVVFLRGLVIGAFVGAAIAGSAALRRLQRR